LCSGADQFWGSCWGGECLDYLTGPSC
jgi:hypothetical protein